LSLSLDKGVTCTLVHVYNTTFVVNIHSSLLTRFKGYIVGLIGLRMLWERFSSGLFDYVVLYRLDGALEMRVYCSLDGNMSPTGWDLSTAL